MAPEESVAQTVGTPSRQVRRTVDFNREACGRTVEVREVRSDGKLTAEEIAVEPAAPQQLPQTALGNRGVVPVLAG